MSLWSADSALTMDSAIALASGYFPEDAIVPQITTPRARTLFVRLIRRIAR